MNAAQRRALTLAQHRYWRRWFESLLARGYSQADARDQADRETQREINRRLTDANYARGLGFEIRDPDDLQDGD